MTPEQRKQLMEDRNKAVVAAQTIIDKAEREKREATPEEEQQIRGHFDEATALDLRFQNDDDQKRFKAELDKPTEEAVRGSIPNGESPETREQQVLASPEYRSAYDTYLRHGNDADLRAQSSVEGTAGGYLVPTNMASQIIKKRTAVAWMRNSGAKVMKTNSTTSIPIITSNGTAGRTPEGEAYTKTALVFGKRKLEAYKITADVEVPDELINDSAYDVQGAISDAIGKIFGLQEHEDFLVGDADEKAAGIVSSATNTVTMASNSVATESDIFNIFFDVPEYAREQATWAMNSQTYSAYRQLKGNGVYLIDPQVGMGSNPMQLLSRPVRLSDYISDIGASARTIVCGDFSGYVIADRGGLRVRKMIELGARNGMIVFLADSRYDGMIAEQDLIRVGVCPA